MCFVDVNSKKREHIDNILKIARMVTLTIGIVPAQAREAERRTRRLRTNHHFDITARSSTTRSAAPFLRAHVPLGRKEAHAQHPAPIARRDDGLASAASSQARRTESGRRNRAACGRGLASPAPGAGTVRRAGSASRDDHAAGRRGNRRQLITRATSKTRSPLRSGGQEQPAAIIGDGGLRTAARRQSVKRK